MHVGAQPMDHKPTAKNVWRSEGWAELPYFLATARSGSLRGAADDLGVNHATVNNNISRLEEHYAVRLFDRTTQGLVLTPAGENLLEKAVRSQRVGLSVPAVLYLQRR